MLNKFLERAVISALLMLVVGIIFVGVRHSARADTIYVPGTTLGMDTSTCLAASPSNLLPFVADGTSVECSPFPGNGILSGTTGSIGGSLLVATCTSGTVTITGAAVGMVAVTNPSANPGTNIQWQAYVSAANTVTVNVCTSGLTLTPTATTYRVRVIQ